jgi:formiminoglutamate deiminase
VTRLWCELAWLGGDAPEAGVVLTIDGDRIAGVQRGVTQPPPGAERLAGLTLPGFANAHSHAFQRALRGRTHGGTGTFWTWREQMYALAQRLDPDRYLALARATFAEMALAGITVVGEFHYVHHDAGGRPFADLNAFGRAVIQAAGEAGLRLTLLDACYLHGGLDRFRDVDAEAWAARVDALGEGPRLRVGAAIHSVRAVDPDNAAIVADWAVKRRRPLHAHVSEQSRENDECVAAHGVTPTRLLGDAGALEAAFTAVHATHVTSADVALLGDARTTACLCPTTERDLADGTGPARELADAGAALAVGSDSQAVVDLLEEARAIELDERLARGVRGVHGAAELLRAATGRGYASLGWPEGGTIAAGGLADLTTVALDTVRLAGTEPAEAVAAVVFAGTAADVREVFVGGQRVVRGGAHVALDVAAELRKAVTEVWRS